MQERRPVKRRRRRGRVAPAMKTRVEWAILVQDVESFSAFSFACVGYLTITGDSHARLLTQFGPIFLIGHTTARYEIVPSHSTVELRVLASMTAITYEAPCM